MKYVRTYISCHDVKWRWIFTPEAKQWIQKSYDSLSCIQLELAKTVFDILVPDWIFHNFRASKPVDQRFRTINRLRGSKNCEWFGLVDSHKSMRMAWKESACLCSDDGKSSLWIPTRPFTISELKNPSHDVPQLHKIRRSPDREALKLWKGSSECRALQQIISEFQ